MIAINVIKCALNRTDFTRNKFDDIVAQCIQRIMGPQDFSSFRYARTIQLRSFSIRSFSMRSSRM